jgi:CDGSH-type Zn-finger protein
LSADTTGGSKRFSPHLYPTKEDKNLMTIEIEKKSRAQENSMKITVSRNGPYIVTGGVPLTTSEIRHDEEGNCRVWREVKRYPLQENYALCRCGNSKNKPFCDGAHTKVHFDVTETGDYGPYSEGANVIFGPVLTLTDNKHLCVHAGFCVRAGGTWDLVRRSDNHDARDTAIEEVFNCPSGRLVVLDNATEKAIEPEFEKSIVIVESHPRHEQGPLWVRGGIPIESADGKLYEIRNRVTLCRCGKSKNKPFCDGSHIER